MGDLIWQEVSGVHYVMCHHFAIVQKVCVFGIIGQEQEVIEEWSGMCFLWLVVTVF